MDGWRGHTEERAAGVVLGPGQCPICNRINTEVDTFQVSETASAYEYKSRDVLPCGIGKKEEQEERGARREHHT